MQHRTVTAALSPLIVAMAALTACADAPAERPDGRLALDVAPLTLPGVTGAVYDAWSSTTTAAAGRRSWPSTTAMAKPTAR